MTRITTLLLFVLLLSGCGNGDESPDSRHDSSSSGSSGLTDFELEHGIGPVTASLDIGNIDIGRAQRGADFFNSLCSSCHRMESRFVGPPLGDVAEQRSNEFIVNYILNPEEMTNRHPVGQELLKEYRIIMPYQNVTKEQAIEMVDFFRYYADTGVDLRD